jgi:hypothetical protein
MMDRQAQASRTYRSSRLQAAALFLLVATAVSAGERPEEAGAQAAGGWLVAGGEDCPVQFKIVQDGKEIVPVDGVCTLQPKPFRIRLKGKLDAAGFRASATGALEKRLDAIEGPVVTFDGLGGAFSQGDLWLFEDGAKDGKTYFLARGDQKFFVDKWGCDDKEAAKHAAHLVARLGKVPLVSVYPRTMFPSEGKAARKNHYLVNLRQLEKGTAEGEYCVRTIGEKPPVAGSTVRLVVYAHRDIGKTFSELTWKGVTLKFGQDKSE